MKTNFKFGITERGDAGLDLSWQDRLNAVIGAIIISKSDSKELEEALLKHQNKCIYHATCTGLGNTLFEPNVPTYEKKLEHIWRLIDQGFPRNQIIIRIDPIMPFAWVETLNQNLSINYIKNITNILNFAEKMNINSIRYSYLDLYNHNVKRMSKLPFKFNTDGRLTKNEINLYEINPNLTYYSCGEQNTPKEHQVGCISKNDLKILNLDKEYGFSGFAGQRFFCNCPKQKLELLNKNYQCQHKCIYCYWRDKEDI